MLVENQLRPVVECLLQTGRCGDSNAVLVHQASLPEQRVLEAPLNQLLSRVEPNDLLEPTLLVVGKLTDWRKKLSWFESLPLFGKRLLLCRPRHQSHESARAVRRRGASPEVMPLIEIEPIANNSALVDCLPQLNKHDWVIFTSANGVEKFWQAVAASGLDARVFGRAKIAVIGPGTAKPFEKWGIRPDLIAEEHVAEGLARQILASGPARSALLIRALEARDSLPNSLTAAGLSVAIVAAYTTRKLADENRDRLKLALQSDTIDAMLLTSSSMADALIKALGPNAKAALSHVCVASIGPITTATLAKLGIEANVTASTYTMDGLLDALESYFKPELDALTL
jgi:uroporphyrinogen III methyltransferase/synthase